MAYSTVDSRDCCFIFVISMKLKSVSVQDTGFTPHAFVLFWITGALTPTLLIFPIPDLATPFLRGQRKFTEDVDWSYTGR